MGLWLFLMTVLAFRLVKAVVWKLIHPKGFSWCSQGFLADVKCLIVRALKGALSLHLQHSNFPWSLSSDQTANLQQRWSFTCFPNVICWKSSITIMCSCHLIETWLFMNALVHFRCCPVLYMSGCLSVLLQVPHCFYYHLSYAIPDFLLLAWSH